MNAGILRLGINNGVPTGSSVVVASGGTLDNGVSRWPAMAAHHSGAKRRHFETRRQHWISDQLWHRHSGHQQHRRICRQQRANCWPPELRKSNGEHCERRDACRTCRTITINGNLLFRRSLQPKDGGFGTPVTINGNITADAGATLGGEDRGLHICGDYANITLSGVTSSQDLGR